MTYEYECKKCGIITEVEHGMSESPEVHCMECGGETVRLVTGGQGYIFKCGGFFSTSNKKPESIDNFK